MRRSGSLKRRPRRRSPDEKTASEAWFYSVRGLGEVIGCADPEKEEWCDSVITHPWLEIEAHHICYRQHVPPEAAWDTRNGAMVTTARHRRIHNGREPLRWSELSAERQAALTEFATEFGLTAWLERHLVGYPA